MDQEAKLRCAAGGSKGKKFWNMFNNEVFNYCPELPYPKNVSLAMISLHVCLDVNMRQRRGPVYHEEVSIVGKYRKRGYTKSDSDGGYGYGYPKRSKRSNSDEYKCRYYEESDMFANQSKYNQVFSPECYMSSVIIFGLILLAAFALLHYVNSISHPEDIITRNRTYYETSKFSFVVMSDCIDCSIYMKRITLQSMPIQHVMIHGLACLSINAPHSVAPDSGLSMFIYYRQDFDGLRLPVFYWITYTASQR